MKHLKIYNQDKHQMAHFKYSDPLMDALMEVNLIKRIKILAIFIICTSCGEEIPGLNELKKLCEKDAGLTINKSVEAEGYYDSTRKGDALWMLIPSNYGFIEFCNLDSNQPSFNEPGCWRLTKITRDTGQCNETVDKSLKHNGSDASRKFRDQNCISVEKIEKSEAEFKYEVVREEWWLNESEGIKMRRYTGKIINTKTKDTYGKSISYSLYPGWLHSETKTKFKSTIGCGSHHVTGMKKTIPFATGLIEKTLISGSSKSKGDAK